MIKCVVWDLDDTVWDGIASEQQGAPRIREGVFEVMELCSTRGILQSVASRNDGEVVNPKLEALGLTKFFIYPQISWGSKAASIEKILSAFHIKPADVVFVDDSEFERDSVKAAIHGIAAADGRDIPSLRGLILDSPEIASNEARERVRQYRIEEQRIRDRGSFVGTEQDFLATCNIRVAVSVAVPSDLPRIKELVDRTNQLNTTGVRYSLDELERLLCTETHNMAFIASVCDRYGDYGRAGFLLMSLEENNASILQLIVSCRLMGKGVAQALLYFAAQVAVEQHKSNLRCQFVRTPFNRQMIFLLTSNGLHPGTANDDKVWYEGGVGDHSIGLPPWLQFQDQVGRRGGSR